MSGHLILPLPSTYQKENSTDPSAGGLYYVALFHTHPPWCYRMGYADRDGGPGPEDIALVSKYKVPMFVYDYTKDIVYRDRVVRLFFRIENIAQIISVAVAISSPVA